MVSLLFQIEVPLNIAKKRFIFPPNTMANFTHCRSRRSVKGNKKKVWSLDPSLHILEVKKKSCKRKVVRKSIIADYSSTC